MRFFSSKQMFKAPESLAINKESAQTKSNKLLQLRTCYLSDKCQVQVVGASNHLIYYSLFHPSNKAKLIMFVSLLLSYSCEGYLGERFTGLSAIPLRVIHHNYWMGQRRSLLNSKELSHDGFLHFIALEYYHIILDYSLLLHIEQTGKLFQKSFCNPWKLLCMVVSLVNNRKIVKLKILKANHRDS